MRLLEDFAYEAPPAQVWAVLTDSGFAHDVACRAGAQTWSARTAELPGGGRQVESTQTLMLPDRLPDFARGFVGRSVQVRRVDEWDAPAGDGSVRGRLHVDAPGLPITVTGALTLTPSGPHEARTRCGVDAYLRARVPLVGRRIETAVRPVLLAALRDEQRVGAAWLAGQSRPMCG